MKAFIREASGVWVADDRKGFVLVFDGLAGRRYAAVWCPFPGSPDHGHRQETDRLDDAFEWLYACSKRSKE
jgi:hypothetical protein